MKRILVGLDSSERAPDILSAAVDLAGRTGAKLVLVRAVGVPVDLPVEAYRLSTSSLSEVLQQEAERGLQALATRVAAEFTPLASPFTIRHSAILGAERRRFR